MTSLKSMAAVLVYYGLIASITSCASAQEQTLAVSSPIEAVDEGTKEEAPSEIERYRSVTQHEMRIEGKTVAYQAIAGDTVLRDMQGNARASIFSFSYLRTDVPVAGRPVLFVFNGGPGSASLWIHMGAIGPRRVVLDKDVDPSNTPPFGLEDNPHSILDVADLVFIDPVGTGFSRTAEGVDPKAFWGVDEDAESIAQFIELWLSEHGRWNAPKYVLGESYGSMRAAVLPRALMGGPIYNGIMRGITLNGVILLGTTLGGRDTSGNTPPAPTAAALARGLPGLAVTAAFHGTTAYSGQDAAEVYSAARSFADTAYANALAKQQAGTLNPDERDAVLAKLQAFTGLTGEEIGADLYVDAREFAKIALKGRSLEVGMYDSRYTLPLANSGGDPVADDPAMGRYVPGFVAAFNEMVRDDLDVHTGRPYAAIYWRDLLAGWNWERRGVALGQSFAVDLAWAMRRTPALRLFVASGYYDLVTMPTDAYAELDKADLPSDRVRFENYESGHMLYLGATSQKFSSDLREFITAK
jgi:carboxypeptidase C (cathepsin A)